MAITLPDFTALPDVTPRAVGGIPSLPQEDPGAAGEAALGKGVTAAGGAALDIAAYREVRRNRMDEAMAESDLTNRTIPLVEQLKVETDPEKITALRGQFSQALQDASGAIGNPETRALWLLKNQKHVQVGEADADARNMTVSQDRWRAGFANQLDTLKRNGAVATDPQAFDLARANIDNLMTQAEHSGTLTATQAQAHRNQAKIDMTAGRIDTLMARGQFGEASALLQAHRGDLGPVAAGNFEARIEQKAEKAGTQRDIRDAYYGTGEGARRGAGLIPYTPAGDILSGTGLSAEQYQTYRSHVAQRESASYAQPPNKGGYMGRYQMGQDEIRETAGRLGVPVPSQQQFLSDPNLQERFFENYTLDHHNTLMEQSEQYRSASPAERAGILMGAHLGGVGGVTTYLEGRGDPADANGTHVSDYVRSMGRAMAGAPAAPGAGRGIEVWGDSLGVGLKGKLKTEGTVVGGARPSAILANIQAKPDSYWQGKTVVLPSGSNGNEMPVVEETIKYLQDPARGAKVVAVGYGSKFPEKNAQLREIAKRLNVPVIDAEDVDPKDGVHPSSSGYDSMAAKIRSAAGAPAADTGMPGVDFPYGGTPAGPQLGARPPAGQLEPGNIDLNARPTVRNPDGSISTVRTIGIEENGKQVNIPTVAADGSRILSNDEAVQQYKDTGQHLGKFDTIDNAKAAAEQLHQAQAAQYAGSGGSTPPAAGPAATPAPAAGPLAPHVDIDGITARIQARADAGEITQDRAATIIAGVRHLYNVDQAKEAIARDALETRLKNGMAALQDGHDFDYDPTAIRHYFPADKAEAYIAGLADSRKAGEFTNSLKNASPTEAQAQRNALVADMKDPNATDYPRRKALLAHFDAVSEKLATQLDKDPAAYVVAANPTVNQAYKDYLLAAQQPPADTATTPQEAARQHARAFADYAQASLAAQAHLGVPAEKRAVLAKGQAADLAAKISAIDPTKQSPVAEMRKLAAGYGAGQGTNDYWPQVFGELVKQKLPGPYQLLASMDRPDQAVAAGDLSIALGIIAQKGGMAAIKEASTAEAQKGLDLALETELADFRASTGPQGVGGTKLYDIVKDGARALALRYGYLGESQNAAVQHAVDGIIRNKYDFGSLGPSQVRVPKGTFRDVSVAADIVKADVKPDEFGPVPLRDPALAKVLSPVQAQELWMSAIRNGGWANNKDDSGLVLMGKFRDGGEYPVQRSDGSQIILKFDNVPALVGATPVPPQVSPF